MFCSRRKNNVSSSPCIERCFIQLVVVVVVLVVVVVFFYHTRTCASIFTFNSLFYAPIVFLCLGIIS